MKVRELMSTDVKVCDEQTDLAAAAKIMWDTDCGFVPVVNEERHLVGVITDRDICIAAATRDTRPASILVRDVMSRGVSTCSDDDDARSVLSLLKTRRVRRLPVVNTSGQLTGVISMNDMVARASCRRDAVLPGEEFLDALRAISEHQAATAG
jgi:CBS-domain-containing membrane protein